LANISSNFDLVILGVFYLFGLSYYIC